MEIWFDCGAPTLSCPTLKAGVQDWLGYAGELIGEGARPVFGPQATGPESANKSCLPQNRVIPGFFTSPWKGKESSKHIEIWYVDRPQFATLLLPLTSIGFYPDGNSPGKHRGKSRKTEPLKADSSPPRAEMLAFKLLFLKNLRSTTGM
jgi:hypothetical protein